MRLNEILILVLSLACAWNGYSQGSYPAGGAQSTVAIVLRAEHDTLKAGVPIILTATLTNRSDHEIAFGYDRTRGIFDVDALDETGRLAADKRPGYYDGRLDLERFARTSTPEEVFKSGLLTGHVVWTTLKPGGTLVETIDVGKYYEMTRPGSYEVVVQKPDPETKGMVKSNSIEVTVMKPE